MREEAGGAVLRLIHSADWHLGRAYQQFPRPLQLRLQTDLEGRLEQLLQRGRGAVQRLYLLLGDIFDSWSAGEKAEQVFRQFLEDAGGPVVYCCGNHDPFEPGQAALASHPQLIVLATEPEIILFPQWRLLLAGQSLAPNKIHSPLRLPRLEELWSQGRLRVWDPGRGLRAWQEGDPGLELSRSYYRLYLHHGTVSSSVGGAYSPLQIGARAFLDWDRLILGHVHESCQFTRAGLDLAYSGCLQGAGFDELGPCSYFWADLLGGQLLGHWQRSALRGLQFRRLDLCWEGDPGFRSLREEIIKSLTTDLSEQILDLRLRRPGGLSLVQQTELEQVLAGLGLASWKLSLSSDGGREGAVDIRETGAPGLNTFLGKTQELSPEGRRLLQLLATAREADSDLLWRLLEEAGPCT